MPRARGGQVVVLGPAAAERANAPSGAGCGLCSARAGTREDTPPTTGRHPSLNAPAHLSGGRQPPWVRACVVVVAGVAWWRGNLAAHSEFAWPPRALLRCCRCLRGVACCSWALRLRARHSGCMGGRGHGHAATACPCACACCMHAGRVRTKTVKKASRVRGWAVCLGRRPMRACMHAAPPAWGPCRRAHRPGRPPPAAGHHREVLQPPDPGL